MNDTLNNPNQIDFINSIHRLFFKYFLVNSVTNFHMESNNTYKYLKTIKDTQMNMLQNIFRMRPK